MLIHFYWSDVRSKIGGKLLLIGGVDLGEDINGLTESSNGDFLEAFHYAEFGDSSLVSHDGLINDEFCATVAEDYDFVRISSDCQIFTSDEDFQNAEPNRDTLVQDILAIYSLENPRFFIIWSGNNDFGIFRDGQGLQLGVRDI